MEHTILVIVLMVYVFTSISFAGYAIRIQRIVHKDATIWHSIAVFLLDSIFFPIALFLAMRELLEYIEDDEAYEKAKDETYQLPTRL